MPVTLTIKHVPDAVAEGLRRRAHDHRRSLQQELLLIAEAAAGGGSRVAEPPAPVYAPPAEKARDKPASRSPGDQRLSLDELWRRAARLGAAMPSESTAIVRTDRDGRHRS